MKSQSKMAALFATTSILSKVFFWIPLMICTYLALSPSPPIEGNFLNHVLAFGYLTPALWFAHYNPSQWGTVVMWMTVYAAGLEMVQDLLPPRVGDIWDIGADFVGIAVGVVVYLSARRMSVANGVR